MDKSLFVIFCLKKLLKEAKREREKREREGWRNSATLFVVANCVVSLWVEAVIIFCVMIYQKEAHTRERS